MRSGVPSGDLSDHLGIGCNDRGYITLHDSIIKGVYYTFQWNLVCGRGYLVETSQTILVAGVMVGAMLMTSLADKCGRKMVFIGSILGISFVGFLTSFVNNYIAFAFFRFCTGVFQQVIVISVSNWKISETLYHGDDALLYIANVMLIWAAPIPADRWHCSL